MQDVRKAGELLCFFEVFSLALPRCGWVGLYPPAEGLHSVFSLFILIFRNGVGLGHLSVTASHPAVDKAGPALLCAALQRAIVCHTPWQRHSLHCLPGGQTGPPSPLPLHPLHADDELHSFGMNVNGTLGHGRIAGGLGGGWAGRGAGRSNRRRNKHQRFRWGGLPLSRPPPPGVRIWP
jgi:hypothetical protein